MSKIDDLLAQEAAAAEAYDTSGHVPDHVQMNRPHLGRSTVVSVRLSTLEHAQLQRAAQEANLPISTLLRLWALDRLHADEHAGSVHDRLTRLERAVFQHPA